MTLADRTTIEVISQQYNKLHEIHNKNKASERVDTRFNAHYELYTSTNTPQAEGINVVCTVYENI